MDMDRHQKQDSQRTGHVQCYGELDKVSLHTDIEADTE